ncbi:uncharacterized protein BYT42DRAFT_552009 [Radiomyces spectabilis]|uniref:uncharacterized protein n=1 Tax=Radiomyces spectabilis TaxID=64574 RepID=UPI00221E999D|nr:uncharacterized protein BYT42DRAFT_552009 [Radiomyces spectabilis]KAI8393722.1 hypothetical protein BYT42DRAFT_552009 [Radiomyces spectabilis]
MTHHETVYAVHNFEAENNDEINFHIGEPILVLEKDEKYLDGWWQGRNIHGEVGLFPMNYTSPEKPHVPRQTKSTGSTFMPCNQTDATTHDNGRYNSLLMLESQIDSAISEVQLLPTVDMTQCTNPPPVAHWNLDRVADWLNTVGLGSVAKNFIDHEITGDILLDLTIDSLKELGISTYGKRYKIMHAIQSLKNTATHTSLHSSPLSSELQYTHHRSPNAPGTNSYHPTLPIDSFYSEEKGNRRLNAQSTPPSPVDSDGLYQYPRKAPLPPQLKDEGDHGYDPSSMMRLPTDHIRPISPQSLGSSNVSRSNTFNTMSSKKSSSSNSTMRSTERFPDPKHASQRIPTPSKHYGLDRFDDSSSHSDISASATSNDWSLNYSTIISEDPVFPPNIHKLSVSCVDDPLLHRVSTADAFQAPEHEGWLHKQSDKYKTWNKRWFVLKGSNLFYFKSPKDVRMKGIINLRGYRIVVDDNIHSGKYCFKAQHERERTFFFYTDTEQQMKTWVKELMKMTIARDYQAPVMSSNQIATVSLEVARRMRPRPPSMIMYKPPKLKSSDAKMSMLQEEGKGSSISHSFNTCDEEEDLDHEMDQDHREASDIMEYSISCNDDEWDEFKNGRISSSVADEEETYATMMASSKHQLDDSEDYVNWINAFLPSKKQIKELRGAFQDGETLILLLEAVFNKDVRRPPVVEGGSNSMMVLDILVAAFKFMGREGVAVDGHFTIKDIYGGDEEKIKTMLNAIRSCCD